MRIILDGSILRAAARDDDQSATLVDLIRDLVREGSLHTLLLDPPYDDRGPNEALDVWLGTQLPSTAKACRGLLNASLLRDQGRARRGSTDQGTPRRWHLTPPLAVRIEDRDTSDWAVRRLTLRDALDLLREPLHLLLENEHSDFGFLYGLAGAEGDELRKHARRPGRMVRHSGGCGAIKNWLLTVGSPAELDAALWRQLLRAVILFDSDAGSSDARDLSNTAVELCLLCEKVASVPGRALNWVCLLRREIEAYAPDDGLRVVAGRNQQPLGFAAQVIAWRARPDRAAWAWALDFKKGLHGDVLPNLPHADELKKRERQLTASDLKAPFCDIDNPEELHRLERAFDRQISKALEAAVGLGQPDGTHTPPAWLAALPREYDRGPPDQAPRLELVNALFGRM